MAEPIRRDGRPRGAVFGALLSALLLLIVVGEVVYLASHYRVRFDMTADRAFTLTESTTRVLSRLDKRLLIEAYFSPDAELPTGAQDMRRTLRNVLDEFVQSSRDRIVVQYFDPQSDKELRDKATRIGIELQRVQDREQTTFSNKELWQGLRFRYGDRKKVVPILGFSDRPSAYEAVLTPIVKGLTIDEKPKIGAIAWPALPAETRGMSSRGESPWGFDQILAMEAITDRYEIRRVSLDQGQLVPDDIGRLMLFRPKDLTDRQKYALDQFLMRGGQLCVFADGDDVSLGQSRLLTTRQVAYDAKDAELKFLDQLAHYGARVGTKFVVERTRSAQDPFVFIASFGGGIQMPQQLPEPGYPYWFHPVAQDWAGIARELATGGDGVVDEALASQYAKTFLPGVDPERGKGLTPPSLFWPVAVEPGDPLPAGVSGAVVMRTSPRAHQQTPPRDLNPLGSGQNARETFEQFATRIRQLAEGEPPQQVGLMVDLRGSFPSFFAGRAIPKAREDEEPERDPLEGPVEPREGADSEAEGPPSDQPAATTPADAEPAPLTTARDDARLVVVGDADFLRDDLVTGQYQRIGGPISANGPLFFANLLDWLAEDEDLFALRARVATDRTQRFVTDEEVQRSVNAQKLAEDVRNREWWLRALNVGVPPLLLAVVGLIVLVQRRGRKRAFLAGIER